MRRNWKLIARKNRPGYLTFGRWWLHTSIPFTSYGFMLSVPLVQHYDGSGVKV